MQYKDEGARNNFWEHQQEQAATLRQLMKDSSNDKEFEDD